MYIYMYTDHIYPSLIPNRSPDHVISHDSTMFLLIAGRSSPHKNTQATRLRGSTEALI